MRGFNAAIVGIGMTPVGIYPERTSVGLAAEALREALADTGLQRDDVDGLVWNLGRPSGEDYDTTVDALGLKLRFAHQAWTHGRFTGSSVLLAAMAVDHGLADHVVCLGGIQRPAGLSSAGYGVLPHGDLRPAGFGQFSDEGALVLRRYIELYGVDPGCLAEVVLALRRHASLNPRALLRQPLTREDYLGLPFTVDPLRAADCFPSGAGGAPYSDAGICLIVGRATELAASGRPGVFLLAGQGLQASREETYFGRPGLGLFSQSNTDFAPSPRDLQVFRNTGLAPADIDGFYTYDAFSFLVWLALERFGHVTPGRAWRAVTAEHIAFDGPLPVNTNGGLIGEGHTAGWGHLIEMTRQLRHEAGERQIRDAEILQWATVFGDSLLLTNDRALFDRSRS